MAKNKVRPTPNQEKTFEAIRSGGKTLQEAMIEGGYSHSSSLKPKQNLTDRAGFQTLIEKYREELRKAGISNDLMARVQTKGLVDEDAKVRLEYLKETKKDFGIFQPDNKPSNILIGILPKKDYEW